MQKMLQRAMRVLALLPILICTFGCATPPRGAWTYRTESDPSLTHSVVVLVNNTAAAVPLTFSRFGLKPVHVVVPPLSHQRTLLAPGPYALVRKDGKKIRVVLAARRRYFMRVAPLSK